MGLIFGWQIGIKYLHTTTTGFSICSLRRFRIVSTREIIGCKSLGTTWLPFQKRPRYSFTCLETKALKEIYLTYFFYQDLNKKNCDFYITKNIRDHPESGRPTVQGCRMWFFLVGSVQTNFEKTFHLYSDNDFQRPKVNL